MKKCPLPLEPVRSILAPKDCLGDWSGLLKIFLLILLIWTMGIDFVYSRSSAEHKANQKDGQKNIFIERIPSGSKGGQGYKLSYTAPVPIDVYWRFKTDFDNDFLEDNKFILRHRLVSRENNSVITENEYTSKPNVVFRWKTTFSHQDFRLDFVLLNPETTGHKFHFGHISLIPQGNTTLVIQEAYFNFFGASIWAIYPWSGGMTDFLRYTAQWEHDMVLRLYKKYAP